MASGSSITPSSLSPSELPNVRLCAYFPYNFLPEGKKEGDKQRDSDYVYSAAVSI